MARPTAEQTAVIVAWRNLVEVRKGDTVEIRTQQGRRGRVTWVGRYLGCPRVRVNGQFEDTFNCRPVRNAGEVAALKQEAARLDMNLSTYGPEPVGR